MLKEKNMMITIALAIIIVIAAAVIIYVNLPVDNSSEDTNSKADENQDNTTVNDDIIFSLSYNNSKVNYTLDDLEAIKSFTGQGRYIKTKLLPDSIVIEESQNFTGVPIRFIMDVFEDIPESFNITVVSSDGWTSDFTYDQINGNVDIYNETADIIENETAQMILAYKVDGQYYSEVDPEGETGPLRIAFVGSNNPITSSNLWAKLVVSIEITP